MDDVDRKLCVVGDLKVRNGDRMDGWMGRRDLQGDNFDGKWNSIKKRNKNQLSSKYLLERSCFTYVFLNNVDDYN